MKTSEVLDVPNRSGASRLHHANTVITSCTFLEQGGLLSLCSDRDFDPLIVVETWTDGTL